MKMNIYDHMIMNIQSVSIQLRPGFFDFFKSNFDIDTVQAHASNVYLFALPIEGELTRLSEIQRRFIFEKELSLYQAQYELVVTFNDLLFDSFFEITWHGVVYHGEIETL